MPVGSTGYPGPEGTFRTTGPVGGRVTLVGTGIGRYRVAMASITIWHNPNCSSSRAATDLAEELGVPVDVRKYLLKAERPTRDEFVALLGILEDEPTTLVRRDATFKKLGLADQDVASADQVADVLAAHPEMTQRPVLITDGAAIIGRPKDRIEPFLVAHR